MYDSLEYWKVVAIDGNGEDMQCFDLNNIRQGVVDCIVDDACNVDTACNVCVCGDSIVISRCICDAAIRDGDAIQSHTPYLTLLCVGIEQ